MTIRISKLIQINQPYLKKIFKSLKFKSLKNKNNNNQKNIKMNINNSSNNKLY